MKCSAIKYSVKSHVIRIRTARTAFVVAGLGAAILLGDTSSDYDNLFGEEERRVTDTPSTKDDSALAAKLLTRAADLKDAPDLRRLILERSFELSRRDPDAIATSIGAAKQMIVYSQGVAQVGWRSKLVDLYTTQFKKATGSARTEAGAFLLDALRQEATDLTAENKFPDALKRLNEAKEISRSIRSTRTDEFVIAAKEVQTKQLTAEKWQKLRIRLETQGGDIPLLEQVILAFLLELNDLPSALKLATEHPDKHWAAMIELSKTQTTNLSPDDDLLLADWYFGIFEGNSGVGKVAALGRSQSYLNLFFTSYSKLDAKRLRAVDTRYKVVEAGINAGLGAVASHLIIWNTHNGPDNNYGSREINVCLLRKGRPIWNKSKIVLEWSPGKDLPNSIELPPIPFDAVKIEILSWYGIGGGLAEVQAIAGGENLLLNGRSDVSAAHSPFHGAQNLTDGTTSSADYKSSWIMKSGTAGWAQIELNAQIRKPKLR